MKKTIYRTLMFHLAAGLLLSFSFASPAGAASVKSAHTEVELVSEVDGIKPGKEFWVALRMSMDEHWHTYWKNPGDSGLATKIDWKLPEGFKAGPIHWPYPKRLDLPPLTTYGYEGEVFLLTKITPPQTLSIGETKRIRAKVDWLACEIMCLPGKAELTLDLPVINRTPLPDHRWYKAFGQTRQKLPTTVSSWSISAFEDDQRIVLQLIPSGDIFHTISGVQFFADESEVINHPAVQKFSNQGQTYSLTMKKSTLLEGPVRRLQGVLVAEKGWQTVDGKRALRVDVPISYGIPAGVFQQQASAGATNFWIIILFAFIGGLILNLMPCVLPVLSLKVLYLVEHRTDESKAWQGGVFFTLGVLVSFWVLAGILILLRLGGQQIGWGFQFQSPGFIIFLSTLFFVFSLNLFGLFEIGASLTAFGGKVQDQSSTTGSFMTGILATIVATPCTAPFMGTALGFALSQPAHVAFLIFTSLGFGMAFPFLVLSRFPKLIRFIPKPGPWMITFKKFLGLLLLATVAWLVWVYSLQLGATATMFLVIGLLIIGLGGWVLGALAGPAKEMSIRKKARLIAVLLMLAGFGVALAGAGHKASVQKSLQGKDKKGILWLEYTPDLLNELRAKNERIFVDFTASWCLTCQVNERLALHNPKVVAKFRELNIIAVKVDLTNRDPEGEKFLQEFGRSGIPFYVLYTGKEDQEPVTLAEILTPQMVLDALEKVRN